MWNESETTQGCDDMEIRPLERKYVYMLLGIVIVVSLILFLHFRNSNDESVQFAQIETMFEEVEKNDEEKEEISSTIMVDIKGAIHHPGVYELREGSRLFEVIELAGGLLEEADERQLNLAQLVTDEMMIYVPTEGEMADDVKPNALPQQDDTIAINSADSATLEQLHGIGPQKAAAIISYREEHGPFKEVDDLLQVPGIGPKSLEQIREKVSVQ